MKNRIMEDHGRKIFGVGILAISLISAVALAGQADSSVQMWAAKYSLNSGKALVLNDLQVVKVSLGNQAPKYFSSKALLVGSYLLKNIGQGELIPVSAITKNSNGTSLKQVPLGINKSDLPSNLAIGDLVDLYSIPIKDPNAETSLVTSKARVAVIDSQSQNIGGTVNLLLSIDKDLILQVTSAIQRGRIVVVRNEI